MIQLSYSMFFETEIALVESYEMIIAWIGYLVNTQFYFKRFEKILRYAYNYLFAACVLVFP